MIFMFQWLIIFSATRYNFISHHYMYIGNYINIYAWIPHSQLYEWYMTSWSQDSMINASSDRLWDLQSFMRVSFTRQIFQMVSISTFEILKLAMYDKLSNSVWTVK